MDVRSNTKIKMGSDRNFGLVFGCVFAALAGLAIYRGSGNWWMFGSVGAAFLAAAIFVPRCLKPLNTAWFRFGLMLGAVMSPIVMAAIYFSVFLIVGLVLRLCRHDPLNRTFDKKAQSYWVERNTAMQSMERQF